MSQRTHTTDYIVVGAGASGSVIARRLLDRGYSVHVLEAGPADINPDIHASSGWPALLHSAADWAFVTTPQRHAGNRRLYWPRGKVLGGSSSLNGQIYMRGHCSDYDGWAQLGCTGWDFESVFNLFLRSEDHVDGGSRWHGAGGPLPVERITRPNPTSVAFVEAANALGHQVIDDFNGPSQTGVGYSQLTTRNGRRASAWRGFMAPARGNPRLAVTTGALVHHVIIRAGRAVGVQYSVRGQILQASAESEVVLSAGTIGSPKLLMLSGIGPAEHLAEIGVEATVDLPGVGENLHDHLLVSNIYEASRPIEAPHHNLLECQLFTSSAYWRGPGPDLQPVFMHVVYPADGYPVPHNGYTIAPGIIRPRSRGTLRLASADPATAPHCDPNVLAEPYDLEALVDAVEICREIGASPAFRDWRPAEVAPGPAARTRDHLRAYVRRAVGTYHHQVGTCRMGVDDDAVVAPDLRVRGVDGLRVADASVMPTITAGNTNAPAIMIGEKASDLIVGAPPRRRVTAATVRRDPRGRAAVAGRSPESR
ncbi:GMC family oxidoreductase [Mycobacterium florentinum]|uniref:GMC family oxidoreductase n=1 Tax=Mycobacterium florentinum TaxID=292462 RepID=UPI000A164A42|nr:GMC family oxidoreductase N-terminal domain-containing protein [Mycobacterium florentinum]MCV7408275.1 GMC family oxidoreductase N-terminal domain-containing protein [Mycobacterium florentinum]BBX78231.1 GMC oxidoreductase [Mycobacterium florentinum]